MAPQLASVVTVANNADFLAFHVAARLHRSGLLLNSVQQGIASGLGPVSRRNPAQKQNRHRRPHRPAVTRRPGHSAQRISEPCRDREDRKYLQKVAKWCGILKGMGAVGAEKSAAVRAQHLDRFLRSNRPLRDGLVGHSVHHRLAVLPHHGFAVRSSFLDLLWLNQLRRVIRLQVLHGSLRNQQQGINDASGQQYPQDGAGHVDPEIADGIFLSAVDAANEGNGQRDPHRRRREVMVGQASHLREIAHGGLARIVLPIRVGGEGRGGVKGQCLSDCPELLRIQRQKLLHPLNQVKQQHGDAAEQ